MPRGRPKKIDPRLALAAAIPRKKKASPPKGKFAGYVQEGTSQQERMHHPRFPQEPMYNKNPRISKNLNKTKAAAFNPHNKKRTKKLQKTSIGRLTLGIQGRVRNKGVNEYGKPYLRMVLPHQLHTAKPRVTGTITNAISKPRYTKGSKKERAMLNDIMRNNRKRKQMNDGTNITAKNNAAKRKAMTN